MAFAHVSVMVQEVLEHLSPRPGKRYLDGTLGGGGHAEQILIHSIPDGQLLGLDRDDAAITAAGERLEKFGARCLTRQASFAVAQEVLAEVGWHTVDGVILDLGVSSHQLESSERGFSFRTSGRLDMRMDRRQTLDACQIVNSFSRAELERIFSEFGEEPQTRRLAAAIVAARQTQPIRTTDELAALVYRVKGRQKRDHNPATQVFQALRIAVNEELLQLKRFLENGYQLLAPNGRMVIISFHSLEDRMVKAAFRKWSQNCLCPPRAPQCRCGWSRKVRLLTKRPMVPSDAEIESNPRARSAKLRAVERV